MMRAVTTTPALPTIGTDPYERIASAVREALPGAAGDRLLERIVQELSEAAEHGNDEAAALWDRLELELERAVATDDRTGLPNRGRFMDDLSRSIAAANRYNEPVAVLVAEAPAEDVVDERELGEALLRLVRVTDLVARIAPARFGIILPRTGPVGAALVAARIAGLEGFRLALGNATLGADAATPDDLLALAEASLGERPSHEA